MLIEIHMIQNHSPANLNRDDLGAPKTCYFGGVLRSRISSQCIKRSIRMSPEFAKLLGGVRTRDLAKRILDKIEGDANDKKRVEGILKVCGFKPKTESKAKKPRTTAGEEGETDESDETSQRSKAPLFVTQQAIEKIVNLFQSRNSKSDDELAKEFAKAIALYTQAPDMALSGRMLEPDKSAKKIWEKLEKNVEASLQTAHAISTHAAFPETDYFVAMGDETREEKEEAGADLIGEQLFASACFYKYFSINFEQLVENLGDNKQLAAHTVGTFIRTAAVVNPSGKQNSFAANNPPDGILIEIKGTPISYANAFANPVPAKGEREIISQSIAQLGQYMHDLDTGFGIPKQRFWFSPNLRYPLYVVENKQEIALTDHNIKSLDELIPMVIAAIGFDWNEVQQAIVNNEA